MIIKIAYYPTAEDSLDAEGTDPAIVFHAANVEDALDCIGRLERKLDRERE